MDEGRCWSVQGDGSRCVGPTQPGALFCSQHRSVNAAQVSRIWRAPEAEMPRELVAGLRRADPTITFPAPGAASTVMTGPVASGPRPAESSPSTGPAPLDRSLPAETGEAPLDWLLALLRAAMEGVMAGEGTPLQKANAVARLAGQYLKAFGAKERERENKVLQRRLAAAEARVAALEAFVAAGQSPAPPAAGGVAPPAGSEQSESEREGRPGSSHLPDEGWIAFAGGEPPAPRPATSEALSMVGAVGESMPPD